jgi:hypothetical protein
MTPNPIGRQKKPSDSIARAPARRPLMNYGDFFIETYDTHHTGWKAKITRLDGRPIKTFPDGQEFEFIETMIFDKPENAVAEAKKLIDGGGMS